MFLHQFCGVLLLNSVVYCQFLPMLEHRHEGLRNNSYIHYAVISTGEGALNCTTPNINCCDNPENGDWRNENGVIISDDTDRNSCMYVTRGKRSISLNRSNQCSPPSGLWRCDMPDRIGAIHSLYIYIDSGFISGTFSFSVSVVFTLHTEPRINPPEFTVAYRSQGGPITTTIWTVNDKRLDENAINKSQLILDTSNNSVYENRLRVRGRTSGRYSCQIFVFSQNSLRPYKKTFTTVIEVADQEPTNIAAVVSEPNCTTVNIAVSWEPPVNTPTGYVIYYQQRGEEAMSEKVDKSHANRHTLNGLHRGVTYNISIVALSHHLPSLLVGPVNVFQGPLLVVETQPGLLTFPNTLFSVVCTVAAEYDGQPLNTTITWTRITISPPMNILTENVIALQEYTEREAYILSSSSTNDSSSGVNPSYSTDLCSMSSKWGYQNVLNSTENITNSTVIYRCNAITLGNTSFSDATIVLLDPLNSLSSSIYPTTSYISTAELTTFHIGATETIIKPTTSTVYMSIMTVSNSLVTSSLKEFTTQNIEDLFTESSPSDTADNTQIKAILGVAGVLLVVILASFFLCIVYIIKRKDQRRGMSKDHPENRPQSPTQLSVIYEEVDVIRDVKTTQEIQVMSNEAYGPLHKDNVPTSPNAAYGQVKFIVPQINKNTK